MLLANGLVSHPQVSVFVKEQTSQPVTIVGAVGHPMVYQVMRPTTLLEVLTAAGGISDNAGNVVIVTRPEPPDTTKEEPASATTKPELKEQRITIPLQSLLESGDSVFNIQIYGGDTVTVPPCRDHLRPGNGRSGAGRIRAAGPRGASDSAKSAGAWHEA